MSAVPSIAAIARPAGDRATRTMGQVLFLRAGVPAQRLLRALEHQLESHPGGRARVRQLQFLVADRCNNPTLIWRSRQIRYGACLDVKVSGLGTFVQLVSPGVRNYARRNGHGFLR